MEQCTILKFIPLSPRCFMSISSSSFEKRHRGYEVTRGRIYWNQNLFSSTLTVCCPFSKIS